MSLHFAFCINNQVSDNAKYLLVIFVHEYTVCRKVHENLRFSIGPDLYQAFYLRAKKLEDFLLGLVYYQAPVDAYDDGQVRGGGNNGIPHLCPITSGTRVLIAHDRALSIKGG